MLLPPPPCRLDEARPCQVAKLVGSSNTAEAQRYQNLYEERLNKTRLCHAIVPERCYVLMLRMLGILSLAYRRWPFVSVPGLPLNSGGTLSALSSTRQVHLRITKAQVTSRSINLHPPPASSDNLTSSFFTSSTYKLDAVRTAPGAREMSRSASIQRNYYHRMQD